MSWDVWIGFALASTAVLLMPGPTVMMVVSYALGRGKATGWATVPGVALGDLTAMTVSLMGAGAILATSATLFTVMKLVGAAYLIYLGIKLWRSDPVLESVAATTSGKPRRVMFLNAYMVTALNPKSIAFFVAFVPQFIVPSEDMTTQFAILEATFVGLATLNVALWAVFAGKMRDRFRRPETLRRVNRTGAGFLIGAGLLTAAVRRS